MRQRLSRGRHFVERHEYPGKKYLGDKDDGDQLIAMVTFLENTLTHRPRMVPETHAAGKKNGNSLREGEILEK